MIIVNVTIIMLIELKIRIHKIESLFKFMLIYFKYMNYNPNENNLFRYPYECPFMVPLYKKVAREFIKCYYSIYDNNFLDLGNMYATNPSIIFLNDDPNNFLELVGKIVQKYNITKFNHFNLSYEAQLIGENVLLEINGNLTINDFHNMRFTETIVLVKSGATTYHISNSIKKISQ